MPQVRIRTCYRVVDWKRMEPKARGGGRHQGLYLANMPLVGCSLLNGLARRGGEGADAVGTFYVFVSLVANTPLRGVAVYREDDVLVPMSDEQIAEQCWRSTEVWKRHAAWLLCGTGVGALECVDITLDLPDGDDGLLERYKRRLGARADAGQRLLFDEPRDVFFLPQAAPATKRMNEGRKERTEPNERAVNPGRGAPPQEPVPMRGPDSGVRDTLPNAEKDLLLRRADELSVLLMRLSHEGRLKPAVDAFCDMLAQLLPESTPADRGQWNGMAMTVWMRPGPNGQIASEATRGAYFQACVEKAFQLNLQMSDPNAKRIDNVHAVFSSWARGVGLMRPARRRPP